MFIGSVYLSYWSIRRSRADIWQARWGERLFIAGVGALTLAIVTGVHDGLSASPTFRTGWRELRLQK
jgi:hypothetical protein